MRFKWLCAAFTLAVCWADRAGALAGCALVPVLHRTCAGLAPQRAYVADVGERGHGVGAGPAAFLKTWVMSRLIFSRQGTVN